MHELKIKQEFRDLIPPLADHEKEGLEEDIKHFGCYCPVVTWQGTIIDGHHRYEICMQHKLSFRVEERNTKDLPNEIAVKRWIIATSFNRRNLPLHVRLDLALEDEELEALEAKTRQGERNDLKDCVKNICQPVDTSCETENGRALAKIGEKAKCSHETVRQYKKIKEAKLEKRVADGESIKKVYGEIKKDERQENLKSTEFPKGKYRVIYADPPWSYNDKRAPGTGGAEEQYPTMSLDSICELPVSQIADESAVLFLWVTTPLLQEGLDVMKAWGFNYKTFFVWDKVRPFPGNYNSVAQELLLLGTKGSCLPDCDIRPYSIIKIEKGRHSEKPERFRDLISGMYKYGNKVELFARKKTEGWEVYGNEC